MEVGLVGLPYSGKSTLFQALTGQPAQTPGSIKPLVGMANVPDPRLDLISRHIAAKKIVPATLKVVDVPGLVPGAGNAFLSAIRDVDAIVHVVRAFERADVPHVHDTIDPARDIEAVESELILADLQMVENALPRAEKSARKKEPEAAARLSVLEKVRPALEEGRPARDVVFAPEEARVLKGLAMLSAKPVLYVANVGEEATEARSGEATEGRSGSHLQVCARIEAELAELEERDRSEMLESLGLTEPALAVVARAAYELLGLQSFYTAGDKENRAWTIRTGATAPEAAGAIHTDIQRGFIRAEIYHVDDLAQYTSEKAIKEAGRLRVEGKSYVMRDGDVCHFLFNV